MEKNNLHDVLMICQDVDEDRTQRTSVVRRERELGEEIDEDEKANGQNSHYDTRDSTGEQEVTSGRCLSFSESRHDRAFRRH